MMDPCRIIQRGRQVNDSHPTPRNDPFAMSGPYGPAGRQVSRLADAFVSTPSPLSQLKGRRVRFRYSAWGAPVSHRLPY
jgi:hypothetical protein